MHRLVASVLIHNTGQGTRVLLHQPIAASRSTPPSIDKRWSRMRGLGQMLSAGPGLAVELVRRDLDGCVLAVSGELSLPAPGLLNRSLSQALAGPGRVLVDVAGLRLGSAAAVQVFPSVLAGAGGWPGGGWCCSAPTRRWPERSPRCG